MNMRIDCMNPVSADYSWISSPKYYVYVVHYTTVHAFLSVVDIPKEVVEEGGYPLPTAAVLIDLWINHTDDQPYFRLLYHNNAESDILYSITYFVDLCGFSIYCKLDVFKDFAARVKPDETIEKAATLLIDYLKNKCQFGSAKEVHPWIHPTFKGNAKSLLIRA
ncbi:hypothetical protein KIN20_032686 [Parelaphostrongylus tenuis]|uniref:Uncharacterized protein n=1 Tax=Parelaphostrongylus tenuis TaxID=148309 RepID=A0AAD5WI75_PARTN|nr:hypothetical protein KIN20_032686 [Parelaphostrongylus tenuis]